MDYITDDATLQHDANLSFRKRNAFSRSYSEATRVRKPLSEIASNAATLSRGSSSGFGKGQGSFEHQEVERSGRTKRNRLYHPEFFFESGRESGRNAVGSVSEPTPTFRQWVMMCLPHRKGRLSTLHQLEFLERPATNAIFFARLKLEYEARSVPLYPRLGRLSWLSPRERKLTEIQFVKFQTKFPMSPVVIEIKGNPSLPKDEKDWECTLTADTSTAPLNAGSMVDAFYGDHYEGASIYDWTPRKQPDELPVEANQYGWGLRFVEVEAYRAWFVWAIMGLAIALAFGIRTVVLFTVDKGTGLTVGGNLLMALQLSYGLWQNLPVIPI